MIASRVLTQAEVEAHLRSLGYVPTTNTTATGTFWRHSQSGQHLLVPFPYEEMYPDFILQDLVRHIGRIPTRPLH